MKIFLTGLLLFISIGISSQEDTIDELIFHHGTGKTDTIRVSKKLTPMVKNFIAWGEVFDYDWTKRVGDIEGIYQNTMDNPKNVGVTYVFKDRKDYIVINNDLYLTEVLNIVVFHEMFHLLSNSGEDDHCYDYTCSSIMLPSLDGYLTYTLCNWKTEVRKLFEKLKKVEYEKKEDNIRECKIFSTRED